MFPKSKTTEPKRTITVPSIISSDVRIKGDLVSPGEVQLNGTIEGDLRCGRVTIGEEGSVLGTVTADTIVVKGTVMGTIQARRVELLKSAKVVGDICHEGLSIENGAYIEGRCTHVEDPLDEALPRLESPVFDEVKEAENEAS